MQDIDQRFIGRLGSKMGYFAFAFAEMKRRGLGYEFPHSMEYWEEYLPELQGLFRPGVIETDLVGIHIRRGDFLKDVSHARPLGMDYYRKAVLQFPGERFIVFAENDGDPFTSKVIEFTGAHFHTGSDMDAFNRLAGCKHIITANSSFSYWAALIRTQDGEVCYPSRWANNGWKPKVPTNWIEIPCL